jgi:hypothetical protein
MRKTTRKKMRHDLAAIAGKKDDTMEAAEIRGVLEKINPRQPERQPG